MRYSCPLAGNIVIVLYFRAVILFTQVGISTAKYFLCKRLAAFRNQMRFVFEFGKHCLSVQGCADTVKVIIEKVLAHIRVLCFLQHIFEQKHLVDSACNLCNEDFIIRLGIRLVCA